MYNELEKEKTEMAREKLMAMQAKIREDEDKMLNCDGDVSVYKIYGFNRHIGTRRICW